VTSRLQNLQKPMASIMSIGDTSVKTGEVHASSANKSIGMLSRMLKELSVRRRLKTPPIFAGLRLRAPETRTRKTYDREFIQTRLLANHALDGLIRAASAIVPHSRPLSQEDAPF